MTWIEGKREMKKKQWLLEILRLFCLYIMAVPYNFIVRRVFPIVKKLSCGKNVKQNYRRTVSCALTLVMAVSMIPLSGTTVFAAGETGAADLILNGNVYEIYSAKGLSDFRDKVNSGDGKINGKLMNNIDLSSVCGSGIGNWTMIGKSNGTYEYSGTFDGNGKTISNLYIDGTSSRNSSLFGYVWDTGSIKNLNVIGKINIQQAGSGICVSNSGTIEKCTFSGSVTVAGQGASGIAKTNAGIIRDCVNNGVITMKNKEYQIGGIVAYNLGQITGCVNNGKINAVNGGTVGGIAGNVTQGGVVKNCYNTAEVTGNGSVGGIVGEMLATSAASENCYNIGTVKGANSFGGVVGSMTNAVVNNFYYLDTCVTGGNRPGGTTSKTAAEFASGEVTYLLNGSTSQGTLAWGQKIGTQRYPVFYSSNPNNTVYKITYTGDYTGIDYVTRGDSVKLPICDDSAYYYVFKLLDSDWDGTNVTSDLSITVSKEIKCEHNWGKWTDNGDGTHSRTCSSVCGKTETGEHNLGQWIDNGDGNHIRGCSVCDKTETEEHKFDMWTDNGNGTHSHSCSVCGRKETKSHEYTDSNGICVICGNYQSAMLLDGVYEISNAGQLIWFAQKVNNGEMAIKGKLMKDIDMNKIVWPGINKFNGIFDGNGHAINNLNQNSGVADGKRKGFTLNLATNGVIKNIIFNNANVWNETPSGAVADENDGIISNCIIRDSYIALGNVSNLGGISGINNGTITNSGLINTNVARRWGGQGKTLGGISETNNGTISDCFIYDCQFSYASNLSGAIIADGNEPINCYYYTNSQVKDTFGTAKTKDQFNSGEVTWLLNGTTPSDKLLWGQTLGTDLCPVLGGTRVYRGYVDCNATAMTYSNSPLWETLPDHTFDVWTDNGDGTHSHICSVCGTKETKPHADTDSNNICDDCGADLTVISVTITWGSMEFTYTDASEGTWNPTTHIYDNPTTEGWKPNSDNVDKITVTSESNVTLTASFAYVQAQGITSVNGSFIAEGNPIISPLELTKGNEVPQTVVAYLKLDGKPDENIDKTKLGTITVTIGSDE